ncbi:sulfatase [Aureliella helgolandensis]|uniref:sulfatase n=1 Tax=Aureliella helgolandensis TaxID=2527968 RepID=UPI001E46D474|nr:sulfatase [Aureliella helgolandensis]
MFTDSPSNNSAIGRPFHCFVIAGMLAFGCSTLAAVEPQSSASPEAVAAKPNVLVISIDDLNDWVGCLGGHPQVQTPNMDALAARGTVFTNAHCQSPLCNPSRTSVMTGLRPTTTGVYGLSPWFRTLPEFKDWVTLPQYFQQHGYRTITGGKTYHDAYPPRDQRETGVEFDVWGYHGSGGNPKPAKKIINMQGGHPLMDWGVFPEHDSQQDDYKVATWACEQLDALAQEESSQPFMLFCGFRRPHVPCFAPQKWFDLYPEESLLMPPILRGDRDDTPLFSWYLHWQLPEPRLSWLEQAGEDRSLVRAYLASTSFVDGMVGRVLAELKAQGLDQNTVVVLWSDHGYHLGEKEISGKNTLWDRSTRVPMIIAGPNLPAGARSSQPAELLDIYPTLVDLCDLPARTGLEGHTLRPQLERANAPRQWPAITSHNQGNHAIRTDRWRFIRYADGSEELYDMQEDPNEWDNLASHTEFREVKADLAKWLPQIDRPLAPGSAHRVLTWDGKTAVWEGEPIDPDALER